MKAKLDEKEKAIVLRKRGWAVRKIANELNVSRGSVSLWVRDTPLTEKQQQQLAPRSPLRMGIYHEVAARKRNRAEAVRKEHQAAGVAFVKRCDVDLYVAGCMLYWGEGTKDRTSLCITNSDPDMVRFFMRFLREACSVDDSRITMKIAVYLNNGLTRKDIEAYWLSVTGLPSSQMRKGTTKQCQDSRKHTLPYGTASVTVHSVELLQKIYGSIGEIASIDSNKWL